MNSGVPLGTAAPAVPKSPSTTAAAAVPMSARMTAVPFTRLPSVDERDLGRQLQVDEVVDAAVDLEEAGHRLGRQHLQELVPVLLLEGDLLLLDRERAVDQGLGLGVVQRVEVLGQVLDHGQPLVAEGLPLGLVALVDRPEGGG